MIFFWNLLTPPILINWTYFLNICFQPIVEHAQPGKIEGSKSSWRSRELSTWEREKTTRYDITGFKSLSSASGRLDWTGNTFLDKFSDWEYMKINWPNEFNNVILL